MVEEKKMREEDKKKRKVRLVEAKGVTAGVRQIVKVGGSYYIALPKGFVERHGLKEGDYIPFVGNIKEVRFTADVVQGNKETEKLAG